MRPTVSSSIRIPAATKAGTFAAAFAALVVGAACGGPSASSPQQGTLPATADEAASAVETAVKTAVLEVVAETTIGPGNITVTPAGKVVMTLHQFYQPELRVVSLGESGKLEPFASQAQPDSVLGLQADRDGVVWLLDNGMRSGKTPRLIGWHSEEDRLVKDIDLGDVTPDGAFVNDLVIDTDHNVAYIADPAGGANAAIVVVDLASGNARRVLEGHESVVPEDMDLIIDDTPVRIRTPDGEEIRPRVGINPIAADKDNEWLYYGPMHGTGMFRVATADLRNPALSSTDLAAKVERYADKPICDGITMDDAGNIYLGDLANNAIGVIGPDRNYRVLISDPRLSWTDAFSFAPDGYVYTVANQLQRSATLNAGTDATEPPFHVLRFKPPVGGVVGR